MRLARKLADGELSTRSQSESKLSRHDSKLKSVSVQSGKTYRRPKTFEDVKKDDDGGRGKLIVIVNNDRQTMQKKKKLFMSANDRVALIEALNYVDEVVLSIDEDASVCRTIKSLSPRPDYFANGGGTTNDVILERDICEELNIALADGLGAKIENTPWLIASRGRAA
jgi:glycerol-3-phosphate cytidylyltransferase-like family protein